VTSQLDQSHIGTYELILIAADDGNQQTQRSVKLVIIDKATLNMSTESENQIGGLSFSSRTLTITTAVLLRVGVPLSDAMTENVYLGVVSLSK
jgi:hypothetical protein